MGRFTPYEVIAAADAPSFDEGGVSLRAFDRGVEPVRSERRILRILHRISRGRERRLRAQLRRLWLHRARRASRRPCSTRISIRSGDSPARSSDTSCRSQRYDPALFPPRDGRHLVAPRPAFRIWFEIEAHACDALAELGVIPKEAAKTIWDKGGKPVFDVARIDEIERETKHDVIAFLTHLAEIRRAGGALRAPGHDLVGRARHLPSTCSSRAPPTS
jgi:hypothetical protein